MTDPTLPVKLTFAKSYAALAALGGMLIATLLPILTPVFDGQATFDTWQQVVVAIATWITVAVVPNLSRPEDGIGHYAKIVAAGLMFLAGNLFTILPEGLTSLEITNFVIGALGALGVYQVRNVPVITKSATL